MRRLRVAIILASLFLLLTALPALAETTSGYLHMSGSLSFDKVGFRMEVTPNPIASYSVQIKISEEDPKVFPESDAYYVIRPLKLDMLDTNTKDVTMLSNPARLCYSFDGLDHKRASNLKTWLSIGHFRIGYWDKNANNWVALPSRVYWNGTQGLVEAECDKGSCQIALLWSNEAAPQLSPVYEEGIRIMVDYQILNPGIDPYVKDGRTMVPLRAISESLGARVEWNAAEQRIDLIRNLDKVQLWIGKQEAVKNGQSIPIEVSPEITEQRTFVPLRFVSESFGAKVNWDPVTRTAKILK
ncbi:MAG: hypothetical protein HPY50_07915 [Firmicutes bacterium]|nr:hypothetical protein [Bacillota bacterium]